MDALSLLNGLRFIDSFFPSGGYAFSSGLEAAVHARAITNGRELSHYVADLLRGGLGRREAVAVNFAHGAVTAGFIKKALDADHELDAMKIGRESRLASRQMGRQVIKIAAEQMETSKVLRHYSQQLESGRTPGHLAVAIGLTLASCGWS
ncbi:MAG TPA: urease accessory UreF family protein, partial [Nitrospira sp.]